MTTRKGLCVLRLRCRRARSRLASRFWYLCLKWALVPRRICEKRTEEGAQRILSDPLYADALARLGYRPNTWKLPFRWTGKLFPSGAAHHRTPRASIGVRVRIEARRAGMSTPAPGPSHPPVPGPMSPGSSATVAT